MVHASLAREKMIQSQLAPLPFENDLFSQAFDSVSREFFVDEPFVNTAYAEAYLPAKYGGYMLPAPLLCRVFNEIRDGLKGELSGASALVIGGGGYSAVVGSYIFNDVTYFGGADFAKNTLDYSQKSGVVNFRAYNHMWPLSDISKNNQTKYDIILFDGAVPSLAELDFAKDLVLEGGLMISSCAMSYIDDPHLPVSLFHKKIGFDGWAACFKAQMPFLEMFFEAANNA